MQWGITVAAAAAAAAAAMWLIRQGLQIINGDVQAARPDVKASPTAR